MIYNSYKKNRSSVFPPRALGSRKIQKFAITQLVHILRGSKLFADLFSGVYNTELHNECINNTGDNGDKAVVAITTTLTNDESNDSDVMVDDNYITDTADVNAKHNTATVATTNDELNYSDVVAI